jgi:hypothetical protein
LLYLNSYLTTIPTSAHTSVFILFLRVKPPLGLAFLLWVIPEARCAFYMANPAVQALFSFFLQKAECAFYSLRRMPKEPSNSVYLTGVLTIDLSNTRR